MNSLKFIFLIFLAIPLISSKKVGFFAIPFKIDFDETIEGDNEEETMIKQIAGSSTVIEVGIGNPEQTISLNVHNNNFYTYILSSDLDNTKIKGFNPNESSTYTETEKSYSFEPNDFEENIGFTDSMTLLTSEQEVKLDGLNLLLATSLKDSTKDSQKNGGYVGLDTTLGKYQDSDGFNLVKMLYSSKQTNKLEFYFNYTSKFAGNLYIGEHPTNVAKEIQYADFFKDVDAAKIKDGYKHWALGFNKLKIGEKVIYDQPFTAVYKYGDYYFTAPKKFMSLFVDGYFKDYLGSNDCKQVTIDGYVYFYCQTQDIQSKLGDFTLVHSLYDYLFETKDIYYENKAIKYFLIRFFTDDTDYWEIGQIFLKKYIVAFDQENSKIDLPLENAETIEKESHKKDDSKKKKNAIIALSCLVAILLIVIIVFIVIKIKKRSKGVQKDEVKDVQINYNLGTNPNQIN